MFRYKLFVSVFNALIILSVLLIQFFAVGTGQAVPPINLAGSEEIQTASTLFLPIATGTFPWRSPFGTQSNLPWLSGSPIYQKGIELQINWVRIGGRISWRELQPEEGGPIRWGKLENFEKELRNLKKAHLTPIVIINDFPRWATVEPTSCSAIREEKLPEFARFVGRIVSRYQSPEFNVHHWELGNEPDIDPSLVPQDFVIGCWGDQDDPFYGGERYGKMLTVVGPAIKQSDPAATVWIGGLLLGLPNTTDPNKGKPELFIDGILEAGGGSHFDILPYHRYPAFNNQVVDEDLTGSWESWGGGTVGKARYLRQRMAAYGIQKPVFINESSLMCVSNDFCDPPSKMFFETQANHLVRSYVRGLSEGVAGFIWYTLNGPGWRHTGLLDDKGNPRPAYIAYKELVRQIDRARYRTKVQFTSGVEAYAFSKGGQEIRVAWSIENTPHKIAVPKTRFLKAYNREGKVITPVLVGENYEIIVGFNPVYIHLTSSSSLSSEWSSDG